MKLANSPGNDSHGHLHVNYLKLLNYHPRLVKLAGTGACATSQPEEVGGKLGHGCHLEDPGNFASAGFELKRDAVGADCRDLLLSLTTAAVVPGAVHHRAGGAFAARALLRKVPELGRQLEACGVDALASVALGDRAVPIDATFFDKHARANWTVPGHQDRIMSVAGTTKRKNRIRNGITYAELDAETLAGLVALRVHFDATDGDTGALCVVREATGMASYLTARFWQSRLSGTCHARRPRAMFLF